MKKYKQMTQEYLDDDNLITLLQQEAMEGWMIKSINYSYMTFEKCEPRNIKFQIDYVEITKEYQDILKEQGYQFKCGLDGKKIYYNENLDAQALYNDEDTMYMSYLNYYKPSKIGYSLLWVVICLGQMFLLSNDMLFMFYRHSLSMFLTHTSYYVLMAVAFYVFIHHIWEAIYIIYMRSHYNKKLEHIAVTELDIKLLRSYDFMNKVDIVVLCSIFPYVVICLVFDFEVYTRITLICGLAIFIVLVTFIAANRNKSRIVICTIVASIALTLSYGIYQLTCVELPQDKLYYENEVKEIYIDESNDLLANSKMIQAFHDEYYERNVITVNELFADIIFKEEVVLLDAYKRNAVAYNNYFKFEDLVKSMKVLEDERINEGYLSDEYVIFRKDNQIVSFKTHQSDVKDVLDYYLN